MGMRKALSRRSILKGAIAAAPLIIPASALGKDGRPPPSNRVNLACIGLGGRGTVNLQTFLGRTDVQIVALCDVDAGSDRYEDNWVRGLGPAVEAVKNRYARQSTNGTFAGVDGYRNFREVLARPDIDAVCVSPPDHWHAA